MGFELDQYSYVDMRMTLQDSMYLNEDACHEYMYAWLATLNRYRLCLEAHESFTASILNHGDYPDQPYRYEQDRDLFIFYVSGLSVIDTICYGAYATGTMLDAKLGTNYFKFATPKDKREANLDKTRQIFYKNYPSDDFSINLSALTDTNSDHRTLSPLKEYIEWKEIRNILAHRSAPGRSIFEVGYPKSSEWIFGIEINKDTTATRFAWLQENIERLLDSLSTFIIKYL